MADGRTLAVMQEPIIVITGAARGIGYAAAGLLAKRKTNVILTSREESRARKAAKEIGCDWLALDITDQASVEAAVSALGARYPRIDVLANNSAILLDHYGHLMKLSPETLSLTFDTNVVGAFRLSQALAPLLARSSDARIINVSSGAGQLDGDPQAWAPAYSISKCALNMLTQQLTAVLPSVMVNSMCPGWCRTDMGGPEATLSAEEGADTLVWLALDAPRTLRGQFLRERAVIPW